MAGRLQMYMPGYWKSSASSMDTDERLREKLPHLKESITLEVARGHIGCGTRKLSS
jgi:hypothetical protein